MIYAKAILASTDLVANSASGFDPTEVALESR